MKRIKYKLVSQYRKIVLWYYKNKLNRAMRKRLVTARQRNPTANPIYFYDRFNGVEALFLQWNGIIVYAAPLLDTSRADAFLALKYFCQENDLPTIVPPLLFEQEMINQ